jgi:hypothetical protein
MGLPVEDDRGARARPDRGEVRERVDEATSCGT